MPHPTQSALIATIMATVTLAGCLGGSPEACPQQHGDEELAMELVTEPDIYDGDGWSLLVQCASEHSPLAAFRFTLETPDERTIIVEPIGTWTSPAVFYGPTADTERGDEVQATSENPGNEGDPTYRFEFIDDPQNGLVDADDNIRITYDAGEVGTTTFQSPFEGGQYIFNVFVKEGDIHVVEMPKNFPDPATEDQFEHSDRG